MLTSTHNPRIRNLLSLEKPRERKKTGLFIIEGIKELSLAIEARYELTNVFYCPAIIDESAFESLSIPESILVPVSESVFEKIAYRKTTGTIDAGRLARCQGTCSQSGGKIQNLSRTKGPTNAGTVEVKNGSKWVKISPS